MNRTEFMNQLEILLQNISFAEKEEALQYYNDYFDDAGAENEQSVIEALGNPARVAENIRQELLENQAAGSATAADRAIVEYGKADNVEETKEVPMAVSDGSRIGTVSEPPLVIGESRSTADSGNGEPGRTESVDVSRGYDGNRENVEGQEGGGNREFGKDQGIGGSREFGKGQGTGENRESGGSGGFAGSPGAGGSSGSPGKQGMSGGMAVLMAILAVFASPFIIGLLSIMFGLLVMWLALIFSFGVVVFSMFIVFFLLLIVGGMSIPVDPLVGLGLIGGGLVCGGVGILFLMLTVAMAGIVTPAIFRGIGHLFRFGRKEATV